MIENKKLQNEFCVGEEVADKRDGDIFNIAAILPTHDGKLMYKVDRPEPPPPGVIYHTTIRESDLTYPPKFELNDWALHSLRALKITTHPLWNPLKNEWVYQGAKEGSADEIHGICESTLTRIPMPYEIEAKVRYRKHNILHTIKSREYIPQNGYWLYRVYGPDVSFCHAELELELVAEPEAESENYPDQETFQRIKHKSECAALRDIANTHVKIINGLSQDITKIKKIVADMDMSVCSSRNKCLSFQIDKVKREVANV